VQILGISTDTVEDNATFAQKFEFPYPLLCDSERQVSVAYGACDRLDAGRAKRITYVIGADGTILQAHAEVDAREHPESLLCSL
jgi:peroxiredoxin Q/BCP